MPKLFAETQSSPKRYYVILADGSQIAVAADGHHYADGRIVFALRGETVALFRLEAITGFVAEGQPCLHSSGGADAATS